MLIAIIIVCIFIPVLIAIHDSKTKPDSFPAADLDPVDTQTNRVYAPESKHYLELEANCLTLHRPKSTQMIPLSQIISFEVKQPSAFSGTGRITILLPGRNDGSLHLTTSVSIGNSNNIDFLYDSRYYENACQMQQRIAAYRHTPHESVADELGKFKALLDAGAITQEEYNRIKQQLLDFN